ncbi:inner membrane i-AAA protease supercomplex subunit YME1 [Fusarium oxysporum f. sp. albedinis]|nr:inner membrane i-AAA protease supercomplex subunit YME1 [Fusarium oxysporum f. sp. albedinis]
MLSTLGMLLLMACSMAFCSWKLLHSDSVSRASKHLQKDCQHYWIPAVWFNSRLVQRPKCRQRQVYLIADDTCQKDLSSHGAWEY